MTQKALDEQIGVHVPKLQLHENGSIQHILDVLCRLAVALLISVDLLVFDEEERGTDEELRLEFEVISQFDPQEKAVAKEVSQRLIIQLLPKRWSAA